MPAFQFLQTRQKQPVSPTFVVSTVPIARLKQGDFSEIAASQIMYDPATTSGNGATPGVVVSSSSPTLLTSSDPRGVITPWETLLLIEHCRATLDPL